MTRTLIPGGNPPTEPEVIPQGGNIKIAYKGNVYMVPNVPHELEVETVYAEILPVVEEQMRMQGHAPLEAHMVVVSALSWIMFTGQWWVEVKLQPNGPKDDGPKLLLKPFKEYVTEQ